MMRIIQTLLFIAAFCSGMAVDPSTCLAAPGAAAQPVVSSAPRHPQLLPRRLPARAVSIWAINRGRAISTQCSTGV